MIIGIDIDNVLNNLCEAVLSVYNEDAADNLKVEDIKTYYIENFVKPEFKENFKSYFLSRKVWKRIELIKDCQKYVARLFREGHTIIFITSTEPENLKKKANWLKRNFPYLDIRKSLFSCPKKQYMAGIDILIDDYEKNLIDGKYHKILFSYPWNTNFNNSEYEIYRAKNWEEIYTIISKINSEQV